MAVTAWWYTNAFKTAFHKETIWGTGVKVGLATSSYVPNQDTHDYYNDITNEVANGNGYATGGAALVTPTSTVVTGASPLVKFDADDTAWGASTITARIAFVYDSTPGTAATDPLLFWVDFGADVSNVSGTFTITWSGSGMATIAPADATGFP